MKTSPELAELLDNSPVTGNQIGVQTHQDPVWSQIVQFWQQGWPRSTGDNSQLKPFFAKKDELSLKHNMMAGQVNIVLRKDILSWSRIFKLVANGYLV